MKIRTIGAALLAIFSVMLSAPSASAAVNVVGGPYTGLKASGDTVRLQLTDFPTVAGMYIQQCLVVSSGRPTSAQCNPASQVWISTATGASFKPTDTIAVPVLGSFGTVNCLVDSCGLFFRLDHTAPTNTSEDRFIKLSFTTSTVPTLPVDEIVTKANGATLAPNAVGTLAYRTPLKLEITTKSGLAPSVKVYGEGCTVAGSTVTALKGSGQCDIAVTSPGNTSFGTTTMHYPVNLVPGVQTFALNLPKQIVGSKLLFTSKAVTNMGERPSVSVESGSACSVKRSGVNTMLTAKALTAKESAGKKVSAKGGTCTITISAPARDGLYSALQQTYTFSVKK